MDLEASYYILQEVTTVLLFQVPSVLSRVFLSSQLTQEFFAGFMGESVEPKDVFLAFTVDQGGNVVNACMCGVGRGGHQVQLPPRQLRSLVEFGHCRVCDGLQEQTDGRAHEEAGSMRRRLEKLRRQQRQAERRPKAA